MEVKKQIEAVKVKVPDYNLGSENIAEENENQKTMQIRQKRLL